MNSKQKQKIVIVLLLVVSVLVYLWSYLPDRLFHVYFLDIGQGDAILLRTPENHQILVDGGPNSKVVDELGEILPFFDKSLDLVVLTHPDRDHLDGVLEVLRRFQVDNLLLTGISDDSSGYKELLAEIERQNINTLIAESNLDFRFGNVVIDLIYPLNQLLGVHFDKPNNSSIAMRILYHDQVILLTGDLEQEAEELLIEELDHEILEANILKAGHHGSKTSSSLPFLRVVKPDIVVIQSGKSNSYGHPHPETLKNLQKIGVKEVYRTDLDGRVEFVF